MNLLYIDLFCGAGGTSTGVNTARLGGEECAKVIACVNHDKNAIASHVANHPDALHFPEDYVLVGTQAEQKKYIGNAVEVTVARCWCEALCAELNKHFKKANNGRKDIFSESRTDAKSAKGVFQNSLANCTAQC